MYFLTAYDSVTHIAVCTYQRAVVSSGGGGQTYRLQVVRTWMLTTAQPSGAWSNHRPGARKCNLHLGQQLPTGRPHASPRRNSRRQCRQSAVLAAAHAPKTHKLPHILCAVHRRSILTTTIRYMAVCDLLPHRDTRQSLCRTQRRFLSQLCMGKNTGNYVQYFLTLVLCTFGTCILRCLVCIVVVFLRVLLSSYVYLLYFLCIAVFTLDAGLLARSQYSESPATGHLDTGFSWFPCVYKQMPRWFPQFQVATTCFSCSPPDLNLLVTNFIFCIHVK